VIVFVINARGRDRVSIMTFWACTSKIELSSDGQPVALQRALHATLVFYGSQRLNDIQPAAPTAGKKPPINPISREKPSEAVGVRLICYSHLGEATAHRESVS
jgi:hypothetical protein